MSKPQLLLLNPIYWYKSVRLTSLGLLSNGAMVRDDCDLVHFDGNMGGYSTKNFLNGLEEKPDIVAIACQYTNRVVNVLEMCKTIKTEWPDVPIICGGTHASLDADFLVTTELIDAVTIGESEWTFEELVHKYLGKHDKPMEEIAGLSILKDGKAFRTPTRPQEEDLDKLPIPAWEVVNHADYMDNSPFGTMTMIETSRGCAFGCTFCSPALLFKRTWRKKTPERVALEFRMAEDRGAEFTWLAELDPCHDPVHIREFCGALVEQGNTIRWFSQQRADQITAHPDLAPLMYAAGCRVANVGYEAMSIRTLRSFNKGTTPEMNRKARDILKEAGIITNGGFIIGVPGETKEEMMQSIRFGLTIDFPDFAILRPYPSTRWSNESGGNDANREKYKNFNEGWCFLHENPKLVEFLHKYATFMAWFHPRRIMAFFSPDDFRRGFCRWRYQVYAEVLGKRILDQVKFKAQKVLCRVPGLNKLKWFAPPKELQEGVEEYAFLPEGALEGMENPGAMASPEMLEATNAAEAEGGNGANGESADEAAPNEADSQTPPAAQEEKPRNRPSA